MDTELHRRRRLSGLLGLASLACLAWPAVGSAQQVTTPNGSVTIDYGVLNSVGQASGGYGAQPSWPYSPSVNPYDQSAAANAYGQQAPYPTASRPGAIATRATSSLSIRRRNIR